ncbi:MAG: MerR family transcriptional regulator [Coriobacteriaceae bacterium]|nr:MerR family transcriptional regulator [Coriobacteriaceae bacterium]
MRIAEVAKQFDISADTLRYYERIGLLRPVQRNANGVRDYSEEDCARIGFVKCMRGANVSIEALIEYMRLFDEGDATLEARKQILIEQRDAARERLARVQAGLDRLDYKIAHYDELISLQKAAITEGRAS